MRPINTLCVIGQLIERVVKDQLIEHFEINNLFAPQQSGFRRFHSCETSINYVLTDWKEALDKSLITIAVFIDLKRAFETVDRTLLLQKLHLYGCDEKVISWFKSYFTNRMQKTRFGDAMSDLLQIFIGTSQGSVLSCALFIIFINDIVNVLQYSKIKLFADDTLIYITCKPDELSATIDLLNEDLSSVFKWLCYSKLSLNVSKSKSMFITCNKTVTIPKPIVINDQEIEVVSEFKYLGIVVDSTLSFTNHFEYIQKKLNAKFFVLKRCEHKLNLDSKKLYVSSLVNAHFHYCASILFLLNDTQISELQKIMNRYARLILKARLITPRVDMLEALNWLSVKQTIYVNTLMFIHRIAIGLSPAYLQQHMTRASELHHHETRHNNEFRLKNYKNATSQNNLFYNGLKIYNEFINFKNSRSTTVRPSTKAIAVDFVKTKFPL